MAEPFLGEIRLMSFSFAPNYWAQCNGQLLPINQNQALFSLLGTNFGGDGQTNFALPDLRGRTPIHVGSGYTLGQRSGEEAHTLSIAELPAHTHALRASPNKATTPTAAGNILAAANNLYGPAEDLLALDPTASTSLGGAQAHLNMQPFLTLNFCIALAGIFPSSN